MLIKGGQPTINDVADFAKVSVGTVSRVLSGNKTVGAERRQRVENAIRTLNYRPNMTARAMRTNKINILGLLVPDIANPFFAQIAKEVEVEAEKRGFSVLLANSHGDPDREERQIRSLVERSLSGLIVVACSDNSPDLSEYDRPLICLDRRLGENALAAVGNQDGSRRLGKLIAELGHQHVSDISGPLSTEIARRRALGFRDGFLSATQDERMLDEVEGMFSYQSGEELAHRFLSRSKRPTAIIGANDQIAIGVLRAAREREIAVPDQLSVAGFEDITLASLVAPSLTTVSQPTRALAEAVVTRLIDDWPNIQDVVLQGALVERQSTGPKPATPAFS